jgi:hypothetical protein
VLVLLAGGWFVYASPPYYIQARLYFLLHERELQTLANELSAEPDIRRLAFSSDDRIIATTSDRDEEVDLSSEREALYRKLMRGCRISPVWRIENGVLLYLGGDWWRHRNTQISYIFRTSPDDEVGECETPTDGREGGTCDIRLSSEWSLNYVWVDLR